MLKNAPNQADNFVNFSVMLLSESENIVNLEGKYTGYEFLIIILKFGSLCLLEVSLRKVVKRSKKHHVLLNLRFFLWNPKDSVVKKEKKKGN